MAWTFSPRLSAVAVAAYGGSAGALGGAEPRVYLQPGDEGQLNVLVCDGEPVDGQDGPWHREVRRSLVRADLVAKDAQARLELCVATAARNLKTGV